MQQVTSLKHAKFLSNYSLSFFNYGMYIVQNKLSKHGLENKKNS